MLGRVKLDNTLLTCDQGNFDLTTAQSQKRSLVTDVKDMHPTTVPPRPFLVIASTKLVVVVHTF